MAEAQQVPVTAGGVPNIPGAVEHSRNSQPAQPAPQYVNGDPTHQQQPGHQAPRQPFFPAQQQAPQAQQPQGEAPAAQATSPDVAALLAALQVHQAPAAPAAPAAQQPAKPFEVGSDPVQRALVNSVLLHVPNLDLGRAVGNAVEYGDAKLIDAAYIREVAGDKAPQLLEALNGLVDIQNAAAARSEQAVYAIAGGQDRWNAALVAFEKTAPEYAKTLVREMFDSGNDEKIKAAAGVVVNLAQAGGLIAQPGELLQGQGNLSPSQALSKEEFQEAHRKLDPNSRDFHAQREQLYARRALGKQLGK